MRSFVAIFAALCCISSWALAQAPKPQIIPLHLEDQSPDSEALVIPAGSPLQLASFPPDYERIATFRGRFTLSGIYEIERMGEDLFVSIRTDKRSRDGLPYWRQRAGPEEIGISNPAEFAEAVAPKDQLRKLNANKLPVVYGRVTIVADDYKTSIECDVAGFTARFVSVVKIIHIAARPKSEETC